VLGPTTTLAHGIFVDSHSWTHWPTRDDIALLAETGTTIAHCPVVFARYGHRLESFGAYRRAGVNMGIGTDTAPHNMLEEMREAVLQSRAAAGDVADTGAAEIFDAATVGGARALGRQDLGRLAEGARADLVLVDLNHPLMQPDRDPLRNLIYTAAERAVKDVYIAGRHVVGDGEVLTLDCADATTRLAVAQKRAEDGVPARDADGRTGLEVSPLTLPVVD
jgi:cytosine/adenosine deaminase-related metal-dependent hydrolase